MSWAVVSYAFVVGMAATVNPCGAAMLPAYLTWFTASGSRSSAPTRVLRAAGTGLGVTAGFVVVFGTVGAVVTAGTGAVMSATPYIGITVGVGLVVVGCLSAAGKHVGIGLPGTSRALGGSGRSPRAMVGFGISYGLASLGCALPLFLAGVTFEFTRGGFAAGIASFLAYAVGMGVVLTALAVIVALAPHVRLRRLRAASGSLQRAGGALLVVVGAYIIYYWVVGGILADPAGSGLINAVDSLASQASSVMTAELGAELAVLIASAFALTVLWSRFRLRRIRPVGAEPSASHSPPLPD